MPDLFDRDLESYEALVAGDERTPAELERLAALGLIERHSSGWQAVAPEGIMLQLLTEDLQRLNETRLWLSLLSVRRRPGEQAADAGLVEVLHGRDAGRAAFMDLFRNTRRDLYACDAPPYVDNPRDANTLELAMLRRGMRVRALYDPLGLAVPGRRPQILRSIALGEQARVTDVPMKMWINDEPAALVPLRLDPIDLESWLLVRDPVLISALAALFEMHWERAVPFTVAASSDDSAADQHGPSVRERDLLSLLVSGLTDQEIADHLGVHLRTVSRWLRHLMMCLDAGTRFQAGYQAMQRGWLPVEDGWLT